MAQKKAQKKTQKFEPLGDRVVIEPLEEEGTTPSGIVLPETAKKKPQEGIVLAVGTGRVLDNGEREPMEVKVKDKVLYTKYAGTEVEVDDKKLLIMSQKDILAIIKG